VYGLVRTKEGGTRQTGTLGGVQVCFERWQVNSIYWAVEGYCAAGRIRGRTGRGTEIVSRLTEKEIEGRLGFNFPLRSGRFQIVPYISAGQYKMENKFLDPSPIPATFEDHFDFVGCGFIAVCQVTPTLTVGCHFKSQYMMNGWDEMTDDPEEPDAQSRIQSEWQYGWELPITQNLGYSDWALQLIPFYRYRHFGGMESFPFDFIDTKFNSYGARLMLMRVF
jgi:hypothetical protein